MTPTPEVLAQARKAVKTCLELCNTDDHIFEDQTPEDGMACSKCIARALAEQDKLYQEVCRNLHDTLSGIATALGLPQYLRAGEAEAPGYPHILQKIALLTEQAQEIAGLRKLAAFAAETMTTYQQEIERLKAGILYERCDKDMPDPGKFFHDHCLLRAMEEIERATWEAAARTIRELAHFNPTLETMAQEFDLRARAAAQGGTK